MNSQHESRSEILDLLSLYFREFSWAKLKFGDGGYKKDKNNHYINIKVHAVARSSCFNGKRQRQGAICGEKKSIRDGNIFKTFLHQNNSGTIVVLQITMPASGMNNVAPVIKRI